MHNTNAKERNSEIDALDRKLRGLSGLIAFPTTPDLVDSVTGSIRDGSGVQGRSGDRFSHFKQPLFIGAGLLIIAIIVLLTTPVGHSIADSLGLPGIQIQFLEGEPEKPEIPDQPLEGLGSPVSLDEAATIAGFEIALPDASIYGDPGEVLIQTTFNGDTAVHLVYAPSELFPETAETKVGMLLTEIKTESHVSFLVKGVFDMATVEFFPLNGDDAYWIEGTSQLMLRGAGEATVTRPSANVLIWTDGELTYRMELSLDFASAMDVLNSMSVDHSS